MRNFSIYIHSEPGFVFNESTSMSPFFYGRQLNDSIKVLVHCNYVGHEISDLLLAFV